MKEAAPKAATRAGCRAQRLAGRRGLAEKEVVDSPGRLWVWGSRLQAGAECETPPDPGEDAKVPKAAGAPHCRPGLHML